MMLFSLTLSFILIAVSTATGVEGNVKEVDQIKPIGAELQKSMESRRQLYMDFHYHVLPEVNPCPQCNNFDPDNKNPSDIQYDEIVETDRHGDDIGGCGRFSSHWDLKMACSHDPNCIGYTFYNGGPWCLKKQSSTRMTSRSDHTFYRKKT